VRWLVVSLGLHVVLLAWLAPDRGPAAPATAQVQAPVEDPSPTEVALLEEPATRSGGGGGHAARAGHAVHADPWEQVSIGVERTTGSSETGIGSGDGDGSGGGHGAGLGFGDGGGIARAAEVPLPAAPPPEPPPSRARPARLLHPSRDREVEDDDDLFVARITVDSDGMVVAVHMVTTHPGVRGDQAASAIWTFRYAPALDDDGVAVRSTFEQPFQIR
jgi:hypothetical protein